MACTGWWIGAVNMYFSAEGDIKYVATIQPAPDNKIGY